MKDVPVIILCGGRGIYVDGSGERILKALVPVTGEPMLFHVMARYLAAGAGRFLLCAGYQQDRLDRLLLDRGAQALGDRTYSLSVLGRPCQISVVDTGVESPTGDRISRVAPLLGEASVFAVTYSDTLCNVSLSNVLEFHRRHGRLATLLAVRVPTRFRILGMRLGETQVRAFADSPVIRNDYINGGFYFFDRAVLGPGYLGVGTGVVLENSVLETLAASQQLQAYPYEGAWQYLDAERHILPLGRIVQSFEANEPELSASRAGASPTPPRSPG